ncbi:MAG: DUF4974 domain-containing protein [Bacteroidetes bacterium]|nr:DUF4974 domain-containing protein [Bacteroidota bacterium]
MKQDDFDRIERYVSGKSDATERKYVEAFFLDGENNLPFRNYLEKDFTSLPREDNSPKVNLDHILDRVHHVVSMSESLKDQKFWHRFQRAYRRVAAILLLPLVVAGSLFINDMYSSEKIMTSDLVESTIYAPLGSRVSFALPDGTSGMLNSGSQLSYSIPFEDSRHVKLEGEAYFNIKHDENQPFKINAGNSVVTVLGTTFNLSAYPQENYVEIVLKEGKVQFTTGHSDENVTMFPSERLIFSNGEILKSITDPDKYNAWTEGKLVLRGDPFEEVARRIERWYNVKVVLADKELEEYSFRAIFEDDKLEDVLRFLSMTSPIKYKITPRKIHADGTFEKEKVTFYLKHDIAKL